MNASLARAEKQPARPEPGGRAATSRAEAATADTGNQAIQSLFRSGAIHAKLTIGRPDDPLEGEADKVADRVMRKPAGDGSAGSCTCASGGQTCEECQKKEPDQAGGPPTIRRIAESSASRSAASAAPSIVGQALAGSGRPLEASTRADMEGRFGRDFGDVRIHADHSAAKSAAAINALAYTAGSHIAFGQGRYAPQTDAGRRLLAHELAHVGQQNAGAVIRRQTPEDAGAPPAPAPTSSAVPGPTPGAATPAPPASDTQPPGPPAAASPADRQLIEAALKSRDVGDVKAIRNFGDATDAEKFDLIGILLNQIWVGPRDEYALEAIWGSFGDRLLTVASSLVGSGLWQTSIDRGAELENLPVIQRIRAAFASDVIALARGYLDSNDALVVAESAGAGISLEDKPAPDAPTPDQQQNTAAMQAAAVSVAHAQEEMERSRRVSVGYSLGNVPPEAKQYWLPVTFDPFRPPQRATAPVVDLNDPSPMADHHPVLQTPEGPPKLQPYPTVLAAYQMGVSGIRGLTTLYPLLYGVAREGKSSVTRAFAEADPITARAQLATALRRLRADIAQAKAKLGNDLDPLDLTLLHQQLFAGTPAASKTDWTLNLPHQQAQDVTKGHDISKALAALGLEAVSEMAFMLGGVLPGAGAVGASVVGLIATSVKAGISATQYQAMLQASKTAVAPGTELVSEGQVDEAKAKAEADQAALALALINTAVGVAGAASGWASERLAAAQPRGGENEAPPAAKSLTEQPGTKPTVGKLAPGDAIDVANPGAMAPPPATARPYAFRIVSMDEVSGEAVGVVIDNASQANGTFRINVKTGDGVAVSGGRTRTIVGGVIQPERAALPQVAGADTPPPSTTTPPESTSPPLAPADPQAKPLPGAPEPNRLPPAGGFDNAFPDQEPFGTEAEPNIGKMYPGMRQLPAGYKAYDFVRGGTTTAEFSTQRISGAKRTVLTLTTEGGEWLSAKTVLDASNATPEFVKEVVNAALKDMETKSGRQAQYDPVHDWYVRQEAANPDQVILHIQVPGDARVSVEALQTAAEQAVTDSGWSPGVPVQVRVMSWR